MSRESSVLDEERDGFREARYRKIHPSLLGSIIAPYVIQSWSLAAIITHMIPKEVRSGLKALKKINDAIITPKAVSDEILAFCQTLAPTSQLSYVWYSRSLEDAVPGTCFPNVERLVAAKGGETVYGWTIWEFPSTFLIGEFHACWKRPDGEILDITPKNERRILFLPDPVRKFEGAKVENIYLPLTQDLLVSEYIKATLETGRLVSAGLFTPSNEFIQAQARLLVVSEGLWGSRQKLKPR